MVCVSLAWNLFGIWLFGEGHSFSDGIRFPGNADRHFRTFSCAGERSRASRWPLLGFHGDSVAGNCVAFAFQGTHYFSDTRKTQPCLVRTTIFRTETGEATRQAPARPFIPRENSLNHPAVYEFNGPLRSSYPPWFDPTYWNVTDCPQRLGSEP